MRARIVTAGSRREALRLALLLAASGLAACVAPSVHGTRRRESPSRPALFFIGTHGSQLLAARFDPVSGAVTMIGPVADMARPTWAVRHPELPMLYVANEARESGSVCSFRIDHETGALTRLSEVDAGGGGTTHLWLDAPSRTILAANYGGGSVATIPIQPDGSLGPRVSLRRNVGSGPHRRQQGPHAHAVAVDPSGRFALVPDLGADKVFIYGFDRKTHALAPADPLGERHYGLPPGTGPRHLAFHPNGRFVFLLAELTAEVHALRWDASSGSLSPVQTLPLDAPGHGGARSGAEIALSRDGRFVYASNRGDSSILVYAVDARTGALRQIQRVPSGGTTPWSFALHSGGDWMIVANQGSDSVNVLKIDRRSGLLSDTGGKLITPKPVSITFDAA